MKVKELIKELEKCHPESDIMCYSWGDKSSAFTSCKEFCNVDFSGYDKEDIQDQLDAGYTRRESKERSWVYLETICDYYGE